MSSVLVRPIQDSDKEAWSKLWDQFLTFHKSSASDEAKDLTFQRFLDPHVKMWGALAINEDSGTPIGLVHYLSHFHTWDVKDKIYLNDLFVDEGSRVKGVGRKLIEHVYRHADDLGTPAVYWVTYADNHSAQVLYNKIGRNQGVNKYVRDI
ncbi:LANO_0H14378g1_1 [Lachancea nothofagi CBS 11611]|uniref:LANO_0H14378g1_1 n=1 Tax=Lachancea nothofagi CBS 11611 TaxID=1266666 RepID=A0A1G4KMP7_9SACH|nr:LANO_0H14378g1_1 [Lachancea nothofagi CBS 11611]